MCTLGVPWFTRLDLVALSRLLTLGSLVASSNSDGTVRGVFFSQTPGRTRVIVIVFYLLLKETLGATSAAQCRLGGRWLERWRGVVLHCVASACSFRLERCYCN